MSLVEVCCSSENRVIILINDINGHSCFHRINNLTDVAITRCLGAKFQLKLTTFIFWTKLDQKVDFWSKAEGDLVG